MTATASAMPRFGAVVPRLLVLALAVAVGFALFGSFSTVQEAAKAELGLSDVQLSLAQGVAAAIPMVGLSVPIGVLVDRGNRLRLLIAFALLSVAGSMLTAAATGFAMLFAGRMLTGIAMTGGLTAGLSLAADLVVPTRRGWAVFILNLGKSLGQAAGFALTGALFGLLAAGPHGFGDLPAWRAAHYALALVGVAAGLPLLFLREPARHEVAAGTHARLGVVLGELWSRRGFLLPLFAGQVSVVMADAAAVIWAAPVLSRTWGLAPQQFAGWMGALVFAAGIAGGVLGSVLAQKGQASGRRGGLFLGAIAAAAIGIPAALFPLAPSVPVFALAFGTLVTVGGVTGLVTSVALTTLLPNELRGLSIGAFIALAGVVGFGLAPTLVTWVSLWLGGEAQLGRALAWIGVLTSVAALGGFHAAMRRAPLSELSERS